MWAEMKLHTSMVRWKCKVKLYAGIIGYNWYLIWYLFPGGVSPYIGVLGMFLPLAISYFICNMEGWTSIYISKQKSTRQCKAIVKRGVRQWVVLPAFIAWIWALKMCRNDILTCACVNKMKPTLYQNSRIVYPQWCLFFIDSIGLHRMENTSHSDTACSLHLYCPPFDMCNSFDQRTGHKQTCKVTFWSKYGQRTPFVSVRNISKGVTSLFLIALIYLFVLVCLFSLIRCFSGCLIDLLIFSSIQKFIH